MNKEDYVLKQLLDRVKKITKGKPVTIRTVRSVMIMCSSLNFPVVFENDDPKEIAKVCKSLVEKGLVKQFDDNGIPAFIPATQAQIIEYNYRDITQSDF